MSVEFKDVLLPAALAALAVRAGLFLLRGAGKERD